MPSTITLNTIPLGAQGVTNFINNFGLSNNTIYAATLRDIIINSGFPGLFAPSSIDSSKLTTIPGNKVVTRSLSGSKNLTAGGQIAWYSIDTLDIADQAIDNRTIKDSTIGIGKFSVTGTANNTTYLRGDGRWETIPISIPTAGSGISVASSNNTATISVNFASLEEVTGTTPPTNKSVSAKTLVDVLGGGTLSTNYVTIGTNQTITGVKTFNQLIAGNISGNAATASVATIANSVTNGVYTQGDQTIGGIKTFSQYIKPNNIVINNTAPTIYFQDIDNRSATIHINSSLFYILRGGVNELGWDNGPNNRHPMILNLENGDVVFSGNISAFSDERLKNNILTINNALEKTEKLRGVFYEKKETKERGLGVIAQEVKNVLPEAVIEDKDGYLAVSYGNMVGLLIEAIKELNKKVKDLESKLNN